MGSIEKVSIISVVNRNSFDIYDLIIRFVRFPYRVQCGTVAVLLLREDGSRGSSRREESGNVVAASSLRGLLAGGEYILGCSKSFESGNENTFFFW